MKPSGSLRLTFTGDIALGGTFLEKARPKGAPLTYPLAALSDTLSRTDILIVNLEGPLSTDGPPRAGRTSLLNNDPAILDWFSQFPKTVCCLANNHISDYGTGPLLKTRELLADHGILSVGAGVNSLEADTPLIFSHQGITLGILAFTSGAPHVGSILAGPNRPGASAMPTEHEASKRIRALKSQCDTVIVLMHAGFEYYFAPSPEELGFARRAIESGASIVIGHHPHVRQATQQYRGGIIAYSLGNFFLPEMESTDGGIQYRKPYTRSFLLLDTLIATDTPPTYSEITGTWSRNFTMQLNSGYRARRETKLAKKLLQWIENPDYSSFWRRYSAMRKNQLKLERFSDAMHKLLFYRSIPRVIRRR